MENKINDKWSIDKTMTWPELAIGFVCLALFIVVSAFILSVLSH